MDPISVAASTGDLVTIIEHHIKNPDAITSEITTLAAENGHLEILRFLYRKDIFREIDISNIAKNGHLHVLHWLQDNEVAMFGWDATQLAAKKGHLEVIQWLFDNNIGRIDLDSIVVAAWMDT